MHCAANLDETANLTTESILDALDRAAARGEVLELYAHHPGLTVSLARLDTVLARARDLGLPFLTYADLVAGAVGPGVALSFDDHATQAWFDIRPMLAGKRVTFFVSAYGFLDEVARGHIRQLAADGHDIAAHSVRHLRAPNYVEKNGLGPYIDDEVVPSIDILEQEGYTVTSFAYPFGARTSELDDAILEHVGVVRSIQARYSASVQSPCPH